MSNQLRLRIGSAFGPAITPSSRTLETPSTSNDTTEGPTRNTVEYNYKYPVLQSDGTVIIEANFMDRNKENKQIMMAKNSEVPLELKLRGRLPDELDSRIQYRRCRSREPFFVQQRESKIYNGEFIGEEAIHAIPEVERSFNHLREMMFRRSEGKFPDQSEFEMILAGTGGKFNPDGRRDYRLGFTQDQNSQIVQGCPINHRMIKNVDLIAEFHRETALIATKLLESSGCPPDVLDLIRRQYDVNTPCTYGSEDNKYLTATQINLSPISGNGVDLKITIGEVGGLHADFNDAPPLWTVLLNFSKLPKGCDPGRILLTGLRVYADMGPNTALIFKGVHTHLPLPPGPMGDSTLPPYITKYVPELDPSKYIYGRGTNVNYPKKFNTEESGLRLRTMTSKVLVGKDAVIDANLDTPGNREHRKKWDQYANSCGKQISQMFFAQIGKGGRGTKGGHANWVTELGSSFRETWVAAEPPAMTGQGTKANDVPDSNPKSRGFKCPQCEKRYVRINACSDHFGKKHPGFEWQKPAQTEDPDRPKHRAEANTAEPKAAKEPSH
ncbi:hypothetical protein IFR05_015496 [Cadophora sp. M221]|nr:hypothetical protein IFR05_015496 [Cadophora sp. M221]